MKIFGITAFIFVVFNTSAFSKEPDNNNTFYNFVQQDSMEVLAQYSLFSEYYKNKEYLSALPFGWKVIEMDPEMFAKWIYYKMEETLWYLHDSADVDEMMAVSIEDTINYFYDLAAKYYPEDKGYWQTRKAFVNETWLDKSPEEIIAEYELAAEINPNMASYYFNRLGQIYKDNMSDDNDYKSKAIELYTMLAEREPDNPQWNSELESLVDDVGELVALAKKAWDLDKDNLAKAYKYADLAMKAQMYEEALIPLTFLVERSPETVNYWAKLASAHQKLERMDKAEEAYKKLIELEPDNKDHYFNLGIIYMNQGKLAAARIQFQKASSVGDGWGVPIFYEGTLYEKAARNCGEFNFEAKMAYQVAVDTYRRAAAMDASVKGQAQSRISALSTSVPTQEDYFFRGYKSGQTIPLSGSCYDWIGKSVTVP